MDRSRNECLNVSEVGNRIWEIDKGWSPDTGSPSVQGAGFGSPSYGPITYSSNLASTLEQERFQPSLERRDTFSSTTGGAVPIGTLAWKGQIGVMDCWQSSLHKLFTYLSKSKQRLTKKKLESRSPTQRLGEATTQPINMDNSEGPTPKEYVSMWLLKWWYKGDGTHLMWKSSKWWWSIW